jgi:hypothetical protein
MNINVHADSDNLEPDPTDRSNRSPSLNLGPGSLQRGLAHKQGRRNPSSLHVMLPKRPQHTRVGIAPISSPNTPRKDPIHSESSVRPHSCYRPKILQAKCNRKHRNLALCQPPSSGNPTSEMEGRELICRATGRGSAIP